MCNPEYYIQAPYITAPIIYIGGKIPRIKPAKRNEVPEFYRKKRIIDKLEPYLAEILLYVIGFIDLIRKEISK